MKLISSFLFLLLVAPIAGAQAYDVNAEYTVTNGNPNGVWAYGSAPTTNPADFYTQFSSFTVGEVETGSFVHWMWDNAPGIVQPLIWQNKDAGTHFGIPPETISLDPGTVTAIIRFTAPTDYDLALISGAFLPGDLAAQNLVIQLNGTNLWTGTDSGSFDLQEPLSAGDVLDFAVYGSQAYGNTGFDLTISAIPEPSTVLALVMAVAAGVPALRRRRP